MTIEEFKQHNKERTMPKEWIGQGYGYKGKWNPDCPTDIIYIPEYGYKDAEYPEEEIEGDIVPREKAFSYNDFVEMCDGNAEKAQALFDSVDWQFPEGVLTEPWFEWEEENEEEHTDRFLVTEEQLREMVNFGIKHPDTEFYTEVMNDNEDFLSCTFFDKNDDNASGYWELDKEVAE